MKKIITKIRNERLKGNVSLLVIFVLLASSVIALLSINQIQRLLTYWNMTFNYFRAFYLAKAWTELGLTEVYYREAWFEHVINSWDAIISWNFIQEYSGFNPYFTMNISWEFKHLTDDVRYTDKCDDDNRITLGTWEWMILSLFWDKTNWFNEIFNDGTNEIQKYPDDDITNLKMEWIHWDNWDSYFTFWLFDFNNRSMWDIIVKTWDDLNGFLRNNIGSVKWERKYLSIKNSWTSDEVVSFCITNNEDNAIPYSDSLITVRWNYGDMEVGLQSVVKKTTPSWSLNVLWRKNSNN